MKGKILFLATVYTHLAAFHTPFMKLLQDKGYQVYAAASSAEGRRDDVEKAGVTCYEVPFARSPYNTSNVSAYRYLKRLLKENHFDLIHVHTPVAAFMGRFLCKVTNQGPVLYTVHGFHFYNGAPRRNWLLYYNIERLAARWTDGLIVMNGEDYESALRLGFKPGKNLFYVHGVGVDLNCSSAIATEKYGLRSALGIDPDDVVFTCIAELDDNKNHAFLLTAWQELTKRYDKGHLLLVGSGEKENSLRQRVKQSKIPRVHFLGYRKDVPQILQMTDIFTLVSKREGLPKCIMEAMAAGKPVVASDVRGNRDLVVDGHTGILVELGNVTNLVTALKKLACDPEMRKAMGTSGREKIQDYSLENIKSEMSVIYDHYLFDN